MLSQTNRTTIIGPAVIDFAKTVLEVQHGKLTSYPVWAHIMLKKMGDSLEPLLPAIWEEALAVSETEFGFARNSVGSVNYGILAINHDDYPEGEIRLRKGHYRAYGLRHIEEGQKLPAIQAAGYSEISQFVEDVVGNFSEVWQEKSGRLLLALYQLPETRKYSGVTVLEKRTDGPRPWYSVVTGYIANSTYPSEKRRTLVWKRR